MLSEPPQYCCNERGLQLTLGLRGAAAVFMGHIHAGNASVASGNITLWLWPCAWLALTCGSPLWPSFACVRSPCHLVLLLAQTLPPPSSHSLVASPCPSTAHPLTSPMPLATQTSSNGASARAGHEQVWVLYSAAALSHSLWPRSAGSLPARQVRCTSTCTPPRNQLLALCGAWCSHCSFESRARAAALQAERCKGPYTAVHAAK
jgi:hypothetical protein